MVGCQGGDLTLPPVTVGVVVRFRAQFFDPRCPGDDGEVREGVDSGGDEVVELAQEVARVR